MPYHVRPATLLDLDEMAKIYASARAFMRASGNHNQWKDDRPDMNEVRRDILSGHSYVIEENACMVAVFSALPSPDPTYSYIKGAWLNDLPYYVIHKIAKKDATPGILKTAVSFCLEKASDVRIDTHEQNLPMQRALSHLGFVYCGIIYLADGQERNAYQLHR